MPFRAKLQILWKISDGLSQLFIFQPNAVKWFDGSLYIEPVCLGVSLPLELA